MPDDVITETPPQQEQINADAEYITGEGMSIKAFVQQQRAAKAEAAKKAEEKTAQPKSQELAEAQLGEEKTAVTDKSKESPKEETGEKTAADGKSQEPELTLEKVKEFLGESKLEDVTGWKKAYEDREKWNTALKTRAQTLPFLEKLTPEQWDILAPKLLPYVHGKESVPDTPEKFISETLEGLNGAIPENIKVEFYDEDLGENREMTIDKKHYVPIVQKVAGELIKKTLPELPVLRERQRIMQEENQKLQSNNNELVKINGYLVLKSFLMQHPEHAPAALNEKESPVDALFRVGESGEDHPEYGKWLKFESAARLSQDKGILFDQAWDVLYGANERKIKREEEVKEKILQNQQKEAGEKGGAEVQPDPLERQKKALGRTYADVVEEMFK